jgi:translation initiation factor 2 subunit 3
MTDSTATPAILTIREADVLARQATHLVGTLGHVSEGKSTLIRALTGVKTQRHAKEQERNITIHLGYANCKVYQHAESGELRVTQTRDPAPGADWILVAHLSWVDCPGHEAFLATMLGGASIMDTACLIVAANQENIPQPQTLEHLIAAELMGLERIAVIQNKLDLLTEPAALANRTKITAFTADSCAESAPLFPISAQHCWGVNRVLDWVMSLPPPERNLAEPARMTCVRSFDVNRPGPITTESAPLAGAIIGGTLDQGVVAVGDWLEIRPGILRRGPDGEMITQPVLTRVRGIRCEQTELPYAIPGSLIAIATDLDPGLSTANGMVGQRIGVPGTLPPIVGQLDLRFYKLKRDKHEFGKHRVGDRVRICSNVMTVMGTITDMEDKKYITVKLERPLCVGKGERVGILRTHSEAGRELLEGSAEVRKVKEWKHISPAEGESLASPPSRTVEWVPMERPEFSRVTQPSYEELLDAIMSRKEELAGGSARFRMEDPVLNKIPKQTVFTNWSTISQQLDAAAVGDIQYSKHLYDYIQAELNTTASINGQSQMIIRGIWKLEDIRSILRKYVLKYKQCGQCREFNTGLVKDTKVIKVRCIRCNTDNVPKE